MADGKRLEISSDEGMAELIASRLNHDYVAPLTAISNAHELMQIAPDNAESCVNLIGDSVRSAIALLQFYRIAFGASDPREEMSFFEVKRRIEGVMDQRFTQFFLECERNEIYRYEAKMIALCYLCMRSSFSALKIFSVQCDQDGWCLSGNGENFDERNGGLRAEKYWLSEVAPVSSEVHFPILFQTVNAFGFDFSRVRDKNTGIQVFLRKR